MAQAIWITICNRLLDLLDPNVGFDVPSLN
jgi:hypothetical protein